MLCIVIVCECYLHISRGGTFVFSPCVRVVLEVRIFWVTDNKSLETEGSIQKVSVI